MSAKGERRTATAAAIMMVLAAMQLVLFAMSPAPARADHIQPEFVGGTSNQPCAAFQGPGQTWKELKVDPNADGTFTDGTLEVTISNTLNDKSFDWSSNIGVDAVFVKAGNAGSHLYRYDPPTESFGDTGLTTPGDGSSNGISHISFCYDGVDLPPPAGAVCPIPPGAGVIVVNFDQPPSKIHAALGATDSVDGPYTVDIPAGVYDVYLTSRDSNHATSFNPEQVLEQYFVRGVGATEWNSQPISDLPDNLVIMTEKVGSSVTIPALTSLTAIHAAYPNAIDNSIQPVCAVFVPKGQPQPIPVTVVVSGVCVVDQAGNVARVTVDSITPDGDVVVTIGGVVVAEGASEDLALDTNHVVTATSASGNYTPTTNVNSLNVSSASCGGTTPPPPTVNSVKGALGDFVWFDDGDGIQEAGEPGVPAVTVTLLSPSGTVLAQQVTGNDGLYLFDNLDSGNYRVEFCLPGATFTAVNQGSDDAKDSDAFDDKPGCALTSLINLPAGVTDLTWDAGIVVEVQGIQIEPTTTTTTTATSVTTVPVGPVTVDTLPFTGVEVEDTVLLALVTLIAGSVLLVAVGRRRDEPLADPIATRWEND